MGRDTARHAWHGPHLLGHSDSDFDILVLQLLYLFVELLVR